MSKNSSSSPDSRDNAFNKCIVFELIRFIYQYKDDDSQKLMTYANKAKKSDYISF